jgi:hypothetical protein
MTAPEVRVTPNTGVASVDFAAATLAGAVKAALLAFPFAMHKPPGAR